MLVAKSSKVYQDLSTFTALTTLLTRGVNGVRPLMANAEDGDSFITYAVRFNGLKSKDNASEYQLTIWCWANSYDKSIAIADQVYEAIKVSDTIYEYMSATPTYNEQGEIYTELIYNIKN